MLELIFYSIHSLYKFRNYFNQIYMPSNLIAIFLNYNIFEEVLLLICVIITKAYTSLENVINIINSFIITDNFFVVKISGWKTWRQWYTRLQRDYINKSRREKDAFWYTVKRSLYINTLYVWVILFYDQHPHQDCLFWFVCN